MPSLALDGVLPPERDCAARRAHQQVHADLTQVESVYKDVFQKSFPAQIRQLMLYCYKYEE